MTRLSRESMEEAFVKYLETVFEHPEIIRASVRNIVINRENTEDAEKRAFEAGFHDCFSDIDFNLSLAKRTYACEQSESYCVLQEKVTKSGHGFSGRCRRRIVRCCPRANLKIQGREKDGRKRSVFIAAAGQPHPQRQRHGQ